MCVAPMAVPPMSDGLEKAHADAFLALLHAALDPVPIAVYDGVVPSPYPDPATTPACLVYFAAEWPTDGTGNAIDGLSITYRLRAYCHSIGATAAAARSIGGQVRAAVLNIRPTVAGRSCGPIRWYDGQPPAKDETLGALVMDRVDVFEFLTTPG
jgi:hypothetical protein